MASDNKKKLEELRKKVNEAKEARDELNSKLKSKRDSVMGLYNEIDKLLKGARKHKDARDKVNDKVSELKKKRDECNSRIAELNKKLEGMKKSGRGGMSHRDCEKLKSDYEKLNWRMQTSPVPRDKEAEMVRRLGEMELKIKEYEALQPAKKEVAGLEKELKSTRKEADSYHNKLLAKSDEGEDSHAKMHEIYKKVDAKREKAKKAEEEFIRIKDEVDEAHKKFVDVLNELRAEEKRQGIKHAKKKRVKREKLKKEQAEKETNLISELKKGGVIKTDDLIFLQDVEK